MRFLEAQKQIKSLRDKFAAADIDFDTVVASHDIAALSDAIKAKQAVVEAPEEELPAEDSVVEETPAEETETPVEETPVEETPAEEIPAPAVDTKALVAEALAALRSAAPTVPVSATENEAGILDRYRAIQDPRARNAFFSKHREEIELASKR
jgi:hypothetical protein